MPSICLLQQIRERNTGTGKHWDPKWKKLRGKKFIKVDLPDYEEIKRVKTMPQEELRSHMKEKGVAQHRPWQDRPINISATATIFEQYIPPEGDGKISLVSIPGAKQRFERLEKKGKSMLALRKIRNFDEEFEPSEFAVKAQEIYIDVHKNMAKFDSDKLHDLITERAYPEMVLGLKNKTIGWNFIESLEPPRVVHIRTTDILTKDNIYAQVTVRLHTRQTLAIYDRFGRLMHGSEALAKDVLEYAVFEKHMASHYGTWRLHGKVIPNWLPPKDPIFKTFRQPPPPPQDPQPKSPESEDKPPNVAQTETATPALV